VFLLPIFLIFSRMFAPRGHGCPRSDSIQATRPRNVPVRPGLKRGNVINPAAPIRHRAWRAQFDTRTKANNRLPRPKLEEIALNLPIPNHSLS
jgi:hypothetical protein